MANPIYTCRGTDVVFAPSGGDAALTPTSIADASGRISAEWDRGAGALPCRYFFKLTTKAASALTLGKALELYMCSSNQSGANYEGNQNATADAAFAAADKRNNLEYVGCVLADSTTSGEPQVASGYVTIVNRYVRFVWWNAFGVALSSTAADHELRLTPVWDEVQ
jgi:hypothetical protein